MPFTCEVCGKNDFKSEASMKGHKTKMHSPAKGSNAKDGLCESAFTCDVCGKNDFKSEGSMKGHKTKMHSPAKGSNAKDGLSKSTFTCDVCGKNDFKSEGSMKGHKTKMHSLANGFNGKDGLSESAFTCDVCGKNDFKSEGSMKGHKTKMHSLANGFNAKDGLSKSAFTCDVCGKNDFKSEGSMKGHKTKMHSLANGFNAKDGLSESAFTCDVCGKNDFKSEGSMKGHKTKMHSLANGFNAKDGLSESAFTCDVCGKNDFKSEGSMKGHKTKMHSLANGFNAKYGLFESAFTCDVCGKNDFKSEGSMKGHKTKMHSLANGFNAKDGLSESAFTCDVCGKNDFKSEGSMKGHKTKMHSLANGFNAKDGLCESAFTCDVCGKNDFKSEGSMKGHKTKMHSLANGFNAKDGHCESAFTCDVCGKNDFKSEASMKGHKIREHGKEFVKQVTVPHTEVIKERCMLGKNESPTASGSGFVDIQPSSSSVNAHKTNKRAVTPVGGGLVDIPTHNSTPTPRLNNPGGYLSQRMENAKLRLYDINIAAGIVRDFIEGDRRFRKKLYDGDGFKWDIFTSGSYYDKTKNMSPDEFDFMISPLNLDTYMEWNKDMPKGFCKIGLRNMDHRELMTGPYLDPVKFKNMAFKLFGDAADSRNVTRKEKDMDSPAYTIFYNPGSGSPVIDIDLVPSIEIKGWPKPVCCRQKAPTWVSSEELWSKCMAKYHVVAKSCPETGYPENERKLLWRMSFSSAEKHLILHANCGNDRSIRKPIFRFLKTLLEETKRENEGAIKKLCSYHLKMFMLHQFDSWPNDTDDESHKRDSCIHILNQLNTILAQNPTKGFPRIDNYFLKDDNVIRHVPKTETELFRIKLKSELDKIR